MGSDIIPEAVQCQRLGKIVALNGIAVHFTEYFQLLVCLYALSDDFIIQVVHQADDSLYDDRMILQIPDKADVQFDYIHRQSEDISEGRKA